ncbi:hypothetical protein A3A71_04285 [Candidatus Berkelbacteria bacterium RIFCSPLOWO2_01_FULL_50_28]|uniref:Methyltransferase domain-containing protein n=1 Tax=Candidatus Berkelbacteria bacterium RIFCSPLOWO2_01_FULL_50_28 TaxID=1797471 RepID=A0A1F5EAL3_9BACT|nr:MAG: hypothetical protein A2807_03325 [Candidatus Berkelbacteria bacterium RIFCSPHIGHO2_01_FULL_50_36]OGD62430.1 MAG: hypothetical protein A3F39_01860 [Candidatus Berkelbacteria bacterium RIFCSPHIGHO2_12_FULL_50_11]OGD64350.1 MAG: hypothetical protein A3A71_04285 [Candidatus Berkelbacteria bacterium RIFCSPLOWO2_01_FULL_50_28]
MIASDKERQAPLAITDAEPSHLARYQFAAHYLSPEDHVLDVPCGSGYGAALLSDHCSEVCGVDIYQPAIEHADEFFDKDNTHFLVGDAEHLDKLFPGRVVFEVITSFEGIEHLRNPRSFLSGLQALLKASGKLIISTPRKPHGSPYHLQEYSLEEYRALLEEYFSVEKMFGQIFTDIFDLSIRQEDPSAHTHFNFIAVCSKK